LPVGNVAFPWDVVAADFEADAKARAEAPVSDRASGGVTPKRTSRTGEIGYLNPPVIAGLVILAGAGYWMCRRRRSMP
jgi:LPXTG-motif cell wall-anchored protein